MNDFLTWFSVVSLSINVLLIVFSYGLHVSSKKEKESRNSQVKIWMQSALGVSNGLQRITSNFLEELWTNKADIVGAVHSVDASAFSLYQSLYEERTLSEEEYKKEQKILRESTRGGVSKSEAEVAKENN